MSKLCTGCWIVTMLVFVGVSTAAWHKIALDDAERQARIRMLSSFHKQYLHAAGLDTQDYLEKLKKYNEKRSGLLDEYVTHFESGED